MNSQRKHAHVIALAAIFSLALVGCDDDGDGSASSSGGNQSDGASFVPDAEPVAPAVSLRQAAISDTTLSLDVVGHGLTDVYGVSARLDVDEATIGIVSFGGPFDITMGAAQPSGDLVLVATRQGKSEGSDVDGTVLGSLQLTRVPGQSSPIRFIVERSDVVDAAGGIAPGVQWIGGELVVP